METAPAPRRRDRASIIAYDPEGSVVNESGTRNPDHGLAELGIEAGAVYYNDVETALVEHAIMRDEAKLAPGGALLALTGTHTGRSPKDKFTVRDAVTEDTVDWKNNKAMIPAHFEALHADMLAHIRTRTVFVQDLACGADPAHRLPVRFISEMAWHMLFIRNMMRRPERSDLATFVNDWTVINSPSFRTDTHRHGTRTETVIAVSFEKKTVLIGGTTYAGENKKSIFGVMNYILPEKGVMPMHCSANHAEGDPSDAAVFFGLSGTGKTTLSADPDRTLIGDDEHGWSEKGVFNFEGGCYAKTINLSREAEPEIFDTTSRFGAVLENVVMDPETRALDFADDSLTQNTRVCYPLDMIPNASDTGMAGVPKNIVMLTCDSFGVLPPIARLTPAQAMYHFLSGFTAKVAGTEKGVTEPEPTFSTCFGAPFMPRRPTEYGRLLRAKIDEHGATCWLVNTGWTGGAYGTGRRMPIKATRALLTAALNGSLNDAEFRIDGNFGFSVPVAVAGVDGSILNPRDTWADKDAYDAQARKLVHMFIGNFTQYETEVDADVRAAAPAG